MRDCAEIVLHLMGSRLLIDVRLSLRRLIDVRLSVRRLIDVRL